MVTGKTSERSLRLATECAMLTSMRFVILGTVLSVGILAQTPARIQTGPAVGSPIPKFSASDQNGRTQTLESVAGPKGTILVFYRSADW